MCVAEKATNKIDTFRVNGHGLVTSANVSDSVGQVPYGFDIDRRDHVLVSEAATGSVSSYDLDHGRLANITGALADTQAAPCWPVHLRPSGQRWRRHVRRRARRLADQPRHRQRCDLDRFVWPRRLVEQQFIERISCNNRSSRRD